MPTSQSPPRSSDAFDGLGMSIANTVDLLTRLMMDTGRLVLKLRNNPQHRLKELFGALRLCYKDAVTGGINYPRLVEAQKRSWGTRLVYDLHPCPGLCYDDFSKFKTEIEHTLHAKVDIHSRRDRYVLIDVFARQVPTRIEYRRSMSRRIPGHGLSVPIGISAAGLEVIDIAGHLSSMLIGGIRGSGKSKLLRLMLVSIILCYSFKEVELYLMDMKKGLEFELYRGLPHVKAIAGDHASAKKLLGRYVKEMERRGEEMRKARVTHWKQWNRQAPMQLLVIDEFAELSDPEKAQVSQIARLGRAAGMNVVVCTQHPVKEVVPMQTKLNLHHTVAFRTRNKVGSQVILDQGETQASELAPVPGRAIYQGLRTREIQVPYVRKEVAEKLLAPVVADRGVLRGVQP